jgi:hypothetical protein
VSEVSVFLSSIPTPTTTSNSSTNAAPIKQEAEGRLRIRSMDTDSFRRHSSAIFRNDSAPDHPGNILRISYNRKPLFPTAEEKGNYSCLVLVSMSIRVIC